MQWIKRNVFFFASCVVALLLIAGAVFFAFSQMDADTAIQEELAQQVNEANRLATLSPSPTKDNISAVKKEEKRVDEVRGDLSGYFPPYRSTQKMDVQNFKSFLEKAIAELTDEAAKANVALPPKYSFTFGPHRTLFQFSPGSIEAWVDQIQDLRAICGVCFQAKLNTLDNVQRATASLDDKNSTELLAQSVLTNASGTTFSPYVISFRCFSQELGDVLAGFANAPDCIVVKHIAVAPSVVPLPSTASAPAPLQMRPAAAAAYRAPAAAPAVPVEVDMSARYGISSGKGGNLPSAPAPVAPVATRPAAQTVTTVLAEQPLQVTLNLEVIRMPAGAGKK